MIAALVLFALAAVLVAVLIRRFKTGRDTFDILTEAEATGEHAHLTLVPTLEFVPDGFTCLGCRETDALPDSIWCAVCSERVANFPAEPIERGRLQ